MAMLRERGLLRRAGSNVKKHGGAVLGMVREGLDAAVAGAVLAGGFYAAKKGIHVARLLAAGHRPVVRMVYRHPETGAVFRKAHKGMTRTVYAGYRAPGGRVWRPRGVDVD